MRRILLILGFLLALSCEGLLASPAWAQAPPLHKFGGGSAGGCSSGSAFTVTGAGGSGHIYVILATLNSGTPGTNPFGISDSGSDTWTSATGVVSDTNQSVSGQVWYVGNPAAITSITVKDNNFNNKCTLIYFEYSGMATSSWLDQAHGQDNSSASTSCPSGSITTTNASDTLAGFCATRASGVTFTAGGSGATFTLEQTNSTAAVDAGQDANVSSTGTYSSSPGMGTSATSIGFIAAFKQSGGGPPPCTNFIALLGAGCR